MLAIAGKDGHVYGIDRGRLAGVFKTPATTIENADAPVTSPPTTRTCPGALGGGQFNGTSYHPGLGALYVGMVDFCAYFWKDVGPLFDFSVQPRGWITAMDADTGRVLWRYRADAQVQAGLVPTKSGLLFAGDTHGNLLALDAQSGAVLHRLDVQGALNHGLISRRGPHE